MPPVRLIRSPRLHRIEEGLDRRATWLELFFDLVFASAVADVGAALNADYTPLGLVRFGFLFFLIWWAWIGHTFYSTRYDNDDLVHRLLTLGQVFLVAVMSINAKADMASREAAGFAAAYGGLRVLLMVQYLRVRSIPATRQFTTRQSWGIGLGAALWIGSALVAPGLRVAVWILALGVDLATPVFARRTASAPADPAHLPERFGLFTLILLGESVVALMAGMRRQEIWTVPAAASALLGLLVAFSLWWAYFDVLASAGPKAARTAKEAFGLQVWMAAHLPLCFGIGVAAIGVERAIAMSGTTPLGAGALLLAAGVALVVCSLGVLAVTAPDARVFHPTRVLGYHVGLAVVLGLFGWLGATTSPIWLLGGLVAVMVVLIGLEYHRQSLSSVIPAEL